VTSGEPILPLPPLGLTLEEIGRLAWNIEDYGIFVLDPGGRIVSWNLGAVVVTGFTPEEILEQPYDRVSRSAERELSLALESGRFSEADWRLRKDGSQFWGSVVITTLRERETLRCYLVILRDLTRRRELEEELRQAIAQVRRESDLRARESEERFARFTQHLHGLAWIKDLDGKYIFVNDSCVAAFGRSREAIIGRTDGELFAAETAALFQENDRLALAAATGIDTIEVLRHPDGELRQSVVSKFPILDADGTPRLVGGIAIDITERAKAESALQVADRRKDEFLATLSHELRNALAPLRNSLHLLRASDPPGSGQRLYQIMENQVHHLVRLVDDLLEVSRITSGKIELRKERVPLTAIVESAVETSRPDLEAGRHFFDLQLPATSIYLEVDPVRMEQVISNLLTNAAKYTPEGGHIALSATASDGTLEISVRDDGLGIPADMLERVFDLFAQVDRTLKRSQGGLGIGLALARRLAEMHGATLEARSEGLNQGSEFLLRIPFAQRASESLPAESARRPARSGSSKQGVRVLVVDDSRDGADSLVMVLNTLGARARAAYDGASALTAIREYKPVVVLLDISMPEMDGYEVAAAIRRDPELSDVRLIALTGFGSEEQRARSRQAGFDDHLVKPVDPVRLQGLLSAPDGSGG
jgi:PAS domain S-box-containing protein